MTTALIGETLFRPPGERVPINIDATVRERLRDLLYEPYMRGVGYSEFIQRAIDRAREDARAAEAEARPVELDDYDPSLYSDEERATRVRHETGDNTLVALVLYGAGGGTVASLAEDWELTEEQSVRLLAYVKRGWQHGRWADRRAQPDRRRSPITREV